MTAKEATTASASWRGLLGCLGTGALVIGAIVWVVIYFVGKSKSVEERLAREWLTPYVEAIRSGRSGDAWENLTTEAYRAKYSREGLEETHRLALERFGAPKTVTITSAFGTTEISPRRKFHSTVTRWDWEKGPRFYLTFELVDVPGEGFRVDAFKFGGRHKQITPNEVPLGPW